MTTGLLDDTVREGAESLRSIIGHCSPTEFTPADVEQYVALVRGYAQLLRGMWEAERARLDDGVEATAVRHSGSALNLAFEGWLGAAGKVQEWAAAVTLHSGNAVRGLPELAGEVAWAREVQAAARHLLDLVNVRRPPLDMKRLDEAQAEHAQGKYRNVKDVIATRRARQGR